MASFFISRIDSKIDAWLDTTENPKAQALKETIAIANAKMAYQLFRDIFSSDRFKTLKAEGASLQRLLWASTSTKNPQYSDELYVTQLIGKDTVNTVPPDTLLAFNDHGTVATSIENELDSARQALGKLKLLGLSLSKATKELEEEGVTTFATAFSNMLQSIENRKSEIK